MGSSYGANAFLPARLGALKAGLVSSRQWHALLACESFAEQRHVLESTDYAGPLP